MPLELGWSKVNVQKNIHFLQSAKFLSIEVKMEYYQETSKKLHRLKRVAMLKQSLMQLWKAHQLLQYSVYQNKKCQPSFD